MAERAQVRVGKQAATRPLAGLETYPTCAAARLMCACGQPGQRDGLCGGCRLTAIARAARKYRFTDELREELRGAYRLKKYPRARAIARMMEATGWPLHAFKCEAMRMGIVTHHKRDWTAEEEAYLDERAGNTSVKHLAIYLRRSHASVESRIDKLRILRKDRREGYTTTELMAVFGATHGRVKGWMTRGLLGHVRDNAGLRVSAERVERFAREYPYEYDLRRVDQTWFKSLVFGRRRSA